LQHIKPRCNVGYGRDRRSDRLPFFLKPLGCCASSQPNFLEQIVDDLQPVFN